MKNIKRILIVCTGNSCRSVMAEGYFAKRLKEFGMDEIAVMSAGTIAASGFKPTLETVEVMEEAGVDVSAYKSSGLDRKEIETADLILVMSPMHKEKILDVVPGAEDKIFFLREFSSEKSKDTMVIDDPIGKPIDFYRITFELIKDSIEGVLKWLNE